MLLRETFTEEHIRDLQKNSHRDPLLLERTIYAFGLLEALTQVGMPFVFKGGTCLMLLMDSPRRLSTDIDIVVEPGMDLEKYLSRASEIFPFKEIEEQKRIRKNNIEKRHFKFIYDSPVNGRLSYILLDVLFERNLYSELVQKAIQNELLLSKPEYLNVSLPSTNCILADKLTAFAPHTTGVPLNMGKDMEVAKQFYDVSSLLDVFTDFKQVSSTYESIVQMEIDYQGIKSNREDCLWDTFDSALCIASRGKEEKEEYPAYVKGVRELRGHIYTENYTPEIAALRAVRIMYMALCLLSNTEYVRIGDFKELVDSKIENARLDSLRYIRKVDMEAYAYVIKTDRLLTEMQHCD